MSHPNAAVFNEFFANEIEKKIFERNDFLSKMKNVSSYVAGKTVHIPNYNHTATILLNSFQTDQSADYTTESEVTFNLDSYKLKPIKVEDIDELMTNYPKFQTVMGSALNDLADYMGRHILYKLVADATEEVELAGVTMTYEDILAIAEECDSQGLGSERYFLPTLAQYYALLKDEAVRKAADFGQATLPTGVISQIAGVNIMRPKPTMPTHTAGVIDEWGSQTGEKVGLVWHPDMVLTAYNTAMVKTIDAHYGTEISAEQVAGAINPREDKKGLIIVR